MAGTTNNSNIQPKGWLIWMWALILLAVAGAVWALYYQYRHPQLADGQPGAAGALQEVRSVEQVKDSYDLIVVGTDPEGVTAAVSAARNGLSTLLVDGRDRDILGGLMTLGWLNTIDMNYTPEQPMLGGKHSVFNKGLFSEWYDKIEGDSFDVITAANAFYDMVRSEPNIDLLLKTQSIEPLVAAGSGETSAVTGIRLVKADGSTQEIKANAVIDATQDADIAAAAGAPFTTGREDIGDKASRMAVTLVFRLNNVTPEVWQAIKSRLNGDDDPGTGANEVSAWGYGELYSYPEANKGRAKMRGLNIGRQNNGTALINALQIFGIDGVNAKSREEAFAIGKSEVEHVVAHLRSNYPEFANVELDATAPELYVRETRHLIGEYRLSMIDLLENRDQWDRIAFGSYQSDIQRLTPSDSGAIVMHPVQYAVPFRSLVPLKVDGLLVVGRSASYDTLPHGSARVIPTGMAEGQAAGAAAKLAQEKQLTFRQLSASKPDIAELQARLNKQGVELQPFTVKPAPYMSHKAYEGLKTTVSLGLAIGGYKNDFQLDEKSNPKRMVNLINGAKRMKADAVKGDAANAIKGLKSPEKGALTLEQASYTIARAMGLQSAPAEAAAELLRSGLLTDATIAAIADPQSLTNGETYLMIRDWKVALTGKP